MQADSMSEQVADHRAEDAIRKKFEILRKVESVAESDINVPAELNQVRIVSGAKQVPVARTTNGAILDAALKETTTLANLLSAERSYKAGCIGLSDPWHTLGWDVVFRQFPDLPADVAGTDLRTPCFQPHAFRLRPIPRQMMPLALACVGFQ